MSERNLDSLITTPRYKIDEKISMKSEIDVFFNMTPVEQKEILRKILTYRDYMIFKHPEVKAPFITPFKSQTLYIHVVEFKLANQKWQSEATNGVYFKIVMGKKTKKSKIQKECSLFNETFIFKRVKQRSAVIIEAYSSFNQLLGETKIPINTLDDASIVQRWFPIAEKKNGYVIGSISLRYCYSVEKIENLRFLEDTFKVIGSSLEELEKREKQPLPSFLIKVVDYLREYGIKEEGLFRISGAQHLVQEMKDRINTGNTLNFENYSVPVVSTLFKAFFDSLPEPLVPYNFSHFFLETQDSIEDLQVLLLKLPRVNRIILGYLIKFISEVAANEERNKMSIKNLGIIFGPIIFRLNADGSAESSNVNEQLDFSMKGSSCVEKMIVNYHVLFDETEIESNQNEVQSDPMIVEPKKNVKQKVKAPTIPYVYINYDSKKIRREKKKGLDKSTKLTRSFSDEQIPKIDLPCNFEKDVISRIQKATKKQEEEERKEKDNAKKKKRSTSYVNKQQNVKPKLERMETLF